MKIKRSALKQIIKESIADHLSMIDEAGSIAANEAKMAKIQEHIDEAKKILQWASSKPMAKYVETKTIGNVVSEIKDAIKQLEKGLLTLQQEKAKQSKPVAPKKKVAEPEEETEED